MEKRLLVRSVMGALNPADIATKRFSAARLESLRQQGYSQEQINLLISALSVLTQLQGCSGAMDAVTLQMDFSAVFLFTWLLGLAGYIYLAIRPGQPLRSFDFVTAETASNCSHGDNPYDISSEAAETSSDCPAWSQEGMIQWLYDRCERRLEKAVVNQNPLKTSQYLARQGILSNMLAFLETATAETREQVQQVLEDTTDLSSDEDSPTINTGGHQVAMNSRLSTTIATAFVHGIATSNLCGCDMENPKTSEGDMVSFTTLVLTLWTMALGGYTWYWLRKPIMPVIFPPTDLAVQAETAEPEVHEDPPVESMLLVALKRINGRLERAQRRGNNRQCLHYMQSRTWLLSCEAHYTDSSPTEKLCMADIVGDVSNLSEDDESLRHGLVEDEKQLALSEADKAFKAMMCLLEYDRFEEMCKLLGELGEALRDAKPASTDASMPEETQSHRARRYTQCGQSETSDTDYRADVNYGPADQHEPEPDGDENKEMES